MKHLGATWFKPVVASLYLREPSFHDCCSVVVRCLVVKGWIVLHVCGCMHSIWVQSHVLGRHHHCAHVCYGFLSAVLVMAGGEPAGFGDWIIEVLVDSAGLGSKNEVPKEMRNVFRRLARFLVANDFDHVDQLRGGSRARVISLLLVCRSSGRFQPKQMAWSRRIFAKGVGFANAIGARRQVKITS